MQFKDTSENNLNQIINYESVKEIKWEIEYMCLEEKKFVKEKYACRTHKVFS